MLKEKKTLYEKEKLDNRLKEIKDSEIAKKVKIAQKVKQKYVPKTMFPLIHKKPTFYSYAKGRWSIEKGKGEKVILRVPIS